MVEINSSNIKLWSMLGTRATFGAAITELAPDYSNLVVLTADFTKSTGLTKFRDLYPEKFLSVGIAEQNMIGIASGLASEGKMVFASSFASFISSRCYEQIRINLGYMGQNVKLVGIASGVGVAQQGNTHYGLEDVSLMRAIPNMVVICPSDCTEVVKATAALMSYNGPAYLRLVGEGMTPVINKVDYPFEIGKAIKLREGSDVAIIASGTMVNQSLKVAKSLEEKGIDATVVNMHTLKPLDFEMIDSLLGAQLILTIEEGSIVGGLGSAVAEYLSTIKLSPKLIRLGIPDVFPHPGSYQYILGQLGLSKEQIENTIINNL